jgi:hypothetical protein
MDSFDRVPRVYLIDKLQPANSWKELFINELIGKEVI